MERLHRAGRESRFDPARRLADLPEGDVLPHVAERGAILQRVDVLRRQHLVHPPARGGQLLVQLHLHVERAVAHQALPAGRKNLVRVRVQQSANDRRGEHHPADAGPLADLVDDVGQPLRAVLPLVLAKRIAGPLERPVGVELAEDVVLVGAGEGRRPAGNVQRVFLPVLGVGAERDVPDVGDEPDRRQRVAAGGDLHGPFEDGTDGRRRRLDGPLEPEALQDVSSRQVQVAQFDRTHRSLPFFLRPVTFLISPGSPEPKPACPACQDSPHDPYDRPDR